MEHVSAKYSELQLAKAAFLYKTLNRLTLEISLAGIDKKKVKCVLKVVFNKDALNQEGLEYNVLFMET